MWCATVLASNRSTRRETSPRRSFVQTAMRHFTSALSSYDASVESIEELLSRERRELEPFEIGSSLGEASAMKRRRVELRG